MSLITGPSVWNAVSGGISPADEARLVNLEDKYVRTTRFAIISSGTSGTITKPSNSSIVLDDFGGTVDAVICSSSGGKPTYSAAVDGSNVVIGSSFDSSGNYTFTGTPSAYPVAIVYRVQQFLKDFDSSSSDIVGAPQITDGEGRFELAANKSTDGTLSAGSDTLYPSQLAVKTYADNLLSGFGIVDGGYPTSTYLTGDFINGGTP